MFRKLISVLLVLAFMVAVTPAFSAPAAAQTPLPDTLSVTVSTAANGCRSVYATVPSEFNTYSKLLLVQVGISQSESSTSNSLSVCPSPTIAGTNIREITMYLGLTKYQVTAPWKFHKIDRNLIDGTYQLKKQ